MSIIVPKIFQNCSYEYRIKDIKYAQCHIFTDANPCKLLKELHEAKDFRKYFFGTIPLILATFAILINIAYGILLIELWRRKKLISMCRHSFLLSRTISSILALILLYIVLIAWKLEIFQYASAAAFILIGSLSFLTLAGTYVAMTTLLYLAIVHPLRYRYAVNVSRCFIVITILWLISIAFSGIDIAAKSNVRTMNRLALNMVTFTAGSLPILIVMAIAAINLKNFAILGLGDKSSCKTFLYGRLFLQVEILACIAAIVWVLAMIFDPIINFFADSKSIDLTRPCWARQQQISCMNPTAMAITSIQMDKMDTSLMTFFNSCSKKFISCNSFD
uniref:G_PROTEIN_RECEP_F1_2 domain-containing protein n=1 Tax=Loa loa TaxID=7209 RepID=A0A1I7V6P4_LOALO